MEKEIAQTIFLITFNYFLLIFSVRGANVKDYYVQRYPGAVSWFSPGSYALRPPLELKDISNCVCAGKSFWSTCFAIIYRSMIFQ